MRLDEITDISIILNNVCNSECKTCAIWKNDLPLELNMDLIFNNIINSEFKNATYVFQGGEITLYSKFKELIQRLNVEGIKYLVVTNGLEPDKIIEANVKKVSISFDGIMQDTIRKIDSTRKIVDLIERLTAKGIYPRIGYTISSLNEKFFEADLEILKTFMDKYKLPQPYFQLAQFTNIFKLDSNAKKIIIDDKILHKGIEMGVISEKSYKYLSYKFDKCVNPLYFLTVSCEGNVRTCQSFLYDDIIGNVHYQKLTDIYKDNYSLIKMQTKMCRFEKDCVIACHRRYTK